MTVVIIPVPSWSDSLPPVIPEDDKSADYSSVYDASGPERDVWLKKLASDLVKFTYTSQIPDSQLDPSLRAFKLVMCTMKAMSIFLNRTQ